MSRAYYERDDRKRDREYSSSLRPEVLDEIRKPDNYHRLRSSSSRIRDRKDSTGGRSGSTDRKPRSSTSTSTDLRNSGPLPLPLTLAMNERDKRDKFTTVGRNGSGVVRREVRSGDSLPPGLKEDLEVFKRELTKHIRKEVLRLRDEMIDDLRREFALLRQG